MKKTFSNLIVLGIALTLTACCIPGKIENCPKSDENARVNVEMRRYGLGPGSWHMYSSMGTAPNGDIYAGICNYAFSQKLSNTLNGAWLVRYDPGEDKAYPLGDMQDVTGQRGRDKAYAQSKIHTPILFTPDGTAYFGTHSVERDYLPEEYEERFTEGYPGGHWIAYDHATGAFESFGIATPGESLMGMALDPKGMKLYATTHEEAKLVQYDIKRGKSRVLGGIGEYPTRVMTCLDDGKAYTFDDRGYLLRYDPKVDVIEKLDWRIPNAGYEAQLISVFALCNDPDGRAFYGISTLLDEASVKNVVKGGYLLEYRLDEKGNGRLTDLGTAGASDEIVVSEIGLYHAITFGRDGKVYWTASVKDKPIHLMSYDPKTGKKRNHGEMWVESEGAHVYAVFAACTGNDGRLYWGGLLKSDTDTKWSNEVVLMICDPKTL